MTLFGTGTAKKSELYGVIKSKLVEAGWANVSTNPTTEFDIFRSAGEKGDRDLVFQMKNNGVSSSHLSIETTDSIFASVRLISGYTPASGGTGAGVIERTTEPWRQMPICGGITSSTGVDMNTLATYRFSVNKNRMIFTFEYPPALNINPVTWYLGIPDEMYCNEPKSKGLLFVTSSNGLTTNSVLITDNAGELAGTNASKTLGMLCQLTPKNPNSAGNYTLSEIFFGDSSEGTRGKLTGVYALPTQNVSNGDVIVQGGQEYLIVINGSYSSDMFPSKALALPLAPPQA